jgi:Xaa-Pro aminopeptidase
MNTVTKLKALRREMQKHSIAACIIPTTDPHLSEYPPKRWEARAWLTGFTGSAGTVVVTLDSAGLWTDSRYFLQAQQQLDSQLFRLFRQGLPDTPEPIEWLCTTLRTGDTVGIDGSTFSASEIKRIIETINDKNINICVNFCPINSIWSDRPEELLTPIFVHDREYAGRDCCDKIADLRAAMSKKGATHTFISALDQIAWLLNLRGDDVLYVPVFLAHIAITETEAILFTHLGRVSEYIKQYLAIHRVTLREYDEAADFLSNIGGSSTVMLCPSEINYALYSKIPDSCRIVEIDIQPVATMKAIKNPTEIEGFRRAMRHDGAAMVNFLCEMEKELTEGHQITELWVAHTLLEFRRRNQCRSESFATIAGFGPHGAVVHYEADAVSNTIISRDGLLLLDSGGQYVFGTTDLTRTIATGAVTDEMRLHYTLVLKGLIALSSARFPRGTRGIQLDILARQFLWQHGLTYLHGTGHGVGSFLSVHEGPHGIRTNYLPATLEAGMITSVEPGIYIENKYGIRIENLLLVVPDTTTEFGEFLRFETLTLCPLENTLIDSTMLTEAEIKWVEEYHRRVIDELRPLLDTDKQAFLHNICHQVCTMACDKY